MVDAIGRIGVTSGSGITYDLVGRVVSEKPYSAHTLHQNIDRLLRSVRGFNFQDLGENRFVLKFNHPLDRTHALEGCPWLLDRHAMVFSLVPDNANSETMPLDLMKIVVRLHNIPGSLRTSDMASKLCAQLGKVEEVFLPKGDFFHAYIRVRVEVNITEPLLRGTYIRLRDGVRQWIHFTYEKLPVYCYVCGIIGHLEKKCLLRFSDGFEDPGKYFPYGEWLKASTQNQRPPLAPLSTISRQNGTESQPRGPNIFEAQSQSHPPNPGGPASDEREFGEANGFLGSGWAGRFQARVIKQTSCESAKGDGHSFTEQE